MSRTILITPAISLVDEVVQHLRPQGADYSKSLVVFPGKRPAHFLRKALGERQGKSYIPPVVHSFDGLIDLLYEAQPSPGRKITAPDAAVILFRIHRDLPERIGGREFSTFERFLPMGLRIFEELEELAMSCLPAERIVPVLHGIALRGIHSLGSLYEKFYREVEKAEYTTRAMRYVAAASQPLPDRMNDFESTVLAGMFALSEAERRLVQKLATRKETTLVFQEGPGIREKIKELGLVASEKGQMPEKPEVVFLSAPDSHGEVFTLANRLREARKTGKILDHQSVVVVPDPSLLPSLVHHAFSPLGDPYNISIGYPLSRTPIAGFLASLMDAASTRHGEKFSGADYLNAVLHPYVKSIPVGNSMRAARILFSRIEENFLNGKLPPFFRLEDLEKDEEMLKKVAATGAEEGLSVEQLQKHLHGIHEKIVKPLTIRGSVGECAARCIHVLSTIANESPSRRHWQFRTFTEAVLETLGTLCRSLLAEEQPSDHTATLSIIRNCVNEARVPLAGTPLHGLQVLGFLETRNLRFDNVFVLNANDEQIPGQTGRYSLVPHMARTQLGLATRKEQDSIAEYYFSLLLAGARKVTLVFTDSESKMPSRFVERLLWEQEQSGAGLRPVATADYRVTLTHAKPDPIPKTAEVVTAVRALEFSATALDRYLKCGIQFYYSHVLRLKEKEELAADVDRRELGGFVHKVLSDFYRPFVGKELKADALDPRMLEDLTEMVFRDEFGEEEFGNRHLLKIQIKHHLSRFISDFEIARLRGRTPRLLGVEVPANAEKYGFRFRGQIDRMEESEGSIFIYDYKTGSDKSKLITRPHLLDLNDRKGWSKAIGSLQLPFYMLLVSEGMQKEVATLVPSYILLGRLSFGPDTEVPLFDSPGMRDLLFPQLETVIFQLLRELTDVSHPFEPPIDLQEVCPTCPFTHLCGTEWVRKKEFF